MDEKKKKLVLRIASIISWILAAFCLISFAVLLMPVLKKTETTVNLLPFLIVFGVLTLLYSLIGWGLRKFYLWAGILTLLISGLNFLFNIAAVSSNPQAVIGVIISGTLIALAILGWSILK